MLPDQQARVAVVGGGISGLAAAHRLLELMPGVQVRLLESNQQLGGVLQTEQRDGYLIEHSADMITTQEPWAVDLCQRVGLGSELIATNARYRRAFVARGNRLYPVPVGFALLQPKQSWPILTTRLMSLRGRLRLLAERWVPPRRDSADESLASFAIRRFGPEAYRWLIQPLVGGIYTADPQRLSMAATLGRFQEMERTHGSLIRAALRRASRNDDPQQAIERSASGARYGMFAAPRQGMSSLVSAIAARLPSSTIQCASRVRELTRLPADKWRLAWEQSGQRQQEDFDGVILATPAHVTADLLRPISEPIAEQLRAIPLAGVAIVIAGFRREDVGHPLDGFGFVVPLAEERKILSASFASIKFPERAPADQVLVRIFVGGACQSELLEFDDDEILRMALQDLRQLLRLRGAPVFSFVHRWQAAMPQYHVGHLDRVQRIESLVEPLRGLALAGNAYRGVGVPFCIHSGENAAASIAESLAGSSLGLGPSPYGPW